MKRVGIVLTLLPLFSSCRASGEKTQVAIIQDMMASVPYDDYDEKWGQALLLPPEGTIPLDFDPFPYGPGEEEAIRAGAELSNPLAPTPENLARGRKVFETICFVCHGAKGEGDGPIIGRFPNPANLLADHAKSYPDGRIYHVISRGQGIMPSHAVQVRPLDRWRVILYVRRLQGGEAGGAKP